MLYSTSQPSRWTLTRNAETEKSGYPWDQRSLRGIPSYPDLYRVIPGYTSKRYPGISHYKNLVMGYPKRFWYPKTSFLSWLIMIPGYPGISRMSSYPGISQYKSGLGRVSLFQMASLSAGYPDWHPVTTMTSTWKSPHGKPQNATWQSGRARYTLLSDNFPFLSSHPEITFDKTSPSLSSRSHRGTVITRAMTSAAPGVLLHIIYQCSALHSLPSGRIGSHWKKSGAVRGKR